jgi:hypothetical protein
MLARQGLYDELHLQSILVCYFGDGGFTNYSPGLALNHDSPDLHLLTM